MKESRPLYGWITEFDIYARSGIIRTQERKSFAFSSGHLNPNYVPAAGDRVKFQVVYAFVSQVSTTQLANATIKFIARADLTPNSDCG